jgi:acetyl esterase/lipase
MVSSELRKLIANLRSGNSFSSLPNPAIEDIRAGWEKFAGTLVPAADIVFEPASANGVEVEWTTAPGTDPDRVILYFHGGGYTIGTIPSYRNFMGHLSRGTQSRVLAVGYRLAPEHPFPAALEDALASYDWLIEQGVSPKRIIFAGDSAGGGLACALSVANRDRGGLAPAAVVAISPSTDLAKTGASIHERAHLDPIVNYESSMAHALRYVGSKERLKNPLASPLYSDLHGLPPLLVMIGTHDALYDDSTRYAAKAEAAGVKVTLDIWEDMIHVWPFFAELIPEGREAIEKIGAWVKTNVP